MEVSRTALSDFAVAFVAGLPVFLGERAYIVGLKGELGAGKTTFMQEVAKVFGVPHIVTSPTFVLVRTYTINGIPFKRLVHVDAYRLNGSDTDTFGFQEYAANPENLILVEWPENLPGSPAVNKKLEFRVVSRDTREIIETTYGG
ncbi:MAG TPA: tRNA (adenosine(37)-N6)-threonylcarbamoyltransferase complex ATPase subunit type 1 TsaE [Candidatus Paceibacterota bacterium]